MIVSGRCFDAWEYLIRDSVSVYRSAVAQSGSSWLILGYNEPLKSGRLSGKNAMVKSLWPRLELKAIGRGGLNALLSTMAQPESEVVQYAALSVLASDDAYSKRSKLVAIFYAPPGAAPRTRAIAAQHRSIIMGSSSLLMRGAHVEFEIQDLKDLTAFEITKKLIASGGAHAASAFIV